MRVLFVINGLGLGGAERQVVLLSKGLARLGHAVSVYTLSSLATRMDELAGTDVRGRLVARVTTVRRDPTTSKDRVSAKSLFPRGITMSLADDWRVETGQAAICATAIRVVASRLPGIG